MKLDDTTLLVTFAAAGTLAVYDIWTLWRRGAATTISHVVYTLSKEYPVIAFVIGVICGHLFWVNS